MTNSSSTQNSHHERGTQVLQVMCNCESKTENLNDESKGEKAEKYNGRVYYDIVTVQESENDKSLGRRTVWHITAEETANFKRRKFFVAKSDMPKDKCALMQQEKSRRHPIAIIWHQRKQDFSHADSFTRLETGNYF